MLFSLVLMLQLPAEPAAPAAVSQVHLRGELLRRERDGFSPLDDFRLVRLLNEQHQSAGWVLLQAGVDRAVWTASAGRTESPRIPHTHDGILYRLQPVALSIHRDLTDGATWTEGRRSYRVGRQTQHKGHECREVFVSEGPARDHRLLVDVNSHAVVSMEQRVFMGRGDEFRLTLDVETNPQPEHAEADAEFLSRVNQIRDAIVTNRDKPDAALSAEQVAVVVSALPGLREHASSRWAAEFVKRIESDTRNQQNRTRKLADLRNALLGKQLPAFRATSIEGSPFDSGSLKGTVVVLHFWKYRDEPLSDPYGQTGYLDFLYGKLKSRGAVVLGINVDPRYGDKPQGRKADRSARKLAEFMNISYEILADDGAVLKKFGDPRAAAATLPLWIVADKTGRIRVWKAGFYDVDPRTGLKELSSVLDELLR